MPEITVEITLEASGVPPVSRETTATLFTHAQRVRRTAVVAGVTLLLTISLLPIPIIHLLGPPFLLIAGSITAIRQFRATARLHPTRIACPKCGGMNRVGGGLGVRDINEPTERLCENCRRILQMRVEKAEG